MAVFSARAAFTIIAVVLLTVVSLLLGAPVAVAIIVGIVVGPLVVWGMLRRVTDRVDHSLSGFK